MSYYMGDYRGDFYAPYGDPGIGSFFKGLARTAVGFIPGVGPLASKVIGAIGRKAPASLMRLPAAGAITGAARTVASAVARHPVLSAAGAAGALAGAESMMMAHHGGAAVGTRGMHMSKARRGVAPHMVRNRRMNFCNPRALRRSVRRLHSFARHYRKVVGFVSPKRPKGRMYFKKRRKAA
jgi:hypothetical protein